MASKAPPIPPEQRSHPGEKPNIEGERQDRRDTVTDAQSSQPGDDDVNLKEQGRHGNVHQNTHHQGYQQDR
ncbi:conserved hypothetical protein [Phenylobacterium zucineum HLK1]|uniref:Uncharacterized protein n=1 Tax=Phenylobacterium zucineum (strain HLK1) TaxID=450851 RepID=B4RH73_PHEZH|nr:hypothetical protein [Phenylobacterium zucineum]ACG79021.1 conserved hypothetical protein [Phenylobacterium zucineum HLK1]